MSEHTKEPWRYESNGSVYQRILADDGRPVCGTAGGGHSNPFSPKEIEDNARRIVACVNACAGVSTENLEKTAALHQAVGHEFDGLAAQRDELLAALKGARAFIDEITTAGGKYHGLNGLIVSDAYSEAAAAKYAIAKAEAAL